MLRQGVLQGVEGCCQGHLGLQAFVTVCNMLSHDPWLHVAGLKPTPELGVSHQSGITVYLTDQEFGQCVPQQGPWFVKHSGMFRWWWQSMGAGAHHQGPGR